MTAFLQPTPLTETVRVVLDSAEMGRSFKAGLVGLYFRKQLLNSGSCFDQTFQISILWHPTIPIDRMTDIVAAAPALQTDDLNPQTTPDTRPHKSAMAGKDCPSISLCFRLLADMKEMQPEYKYNIIICHFHKD